MRKLNNLLRWARSLTGRIEPPRRQDAPYLLIGVFLTFFSIGPMSEMVRHNPHNIAGLLLTGLFSGSIAVAYAYAGTYRKLWIIPIAVLFQWYVADYIFMNAISLGLVWKVETADIPTSKNLALLAAILSVALGHAFLISFARRIGRVANEQKAQLAIAAEMHRSIVPPIDVKLGSLHIVGRSDASSVMGGDLIDTVSHPHGIDIVLADVSGHGVKAGVVMAMLKASVRTVLGATRAPGGVDLAADPQTDPNADPCARPHLGQCTAELSRVLAELCEPSMFATFVVLRLFTPVAPASTKPGPIKAELCTAGHGPLMHYIASRNQWVEIDNECLPLAISPDECFTVREFVLHPGDRIVILTDGLTEAFGTSGVQFGTDGITASLTAAGSAGPAEICNRLLADSRAHGPQIDDQSVIAIAV